MESLNQQHVFETEIMNKIYIPLKTNITDPKLFNNSSNIVDKNGSPFMEWLLFKCILKRRLDMLKQLMAEQNHSSK